MKISAVTVFVKQEFIDDFIAVSKVHQANTIKEKGNLRLDFLQAHDNPSEFLFYEAYESEADIDLHRQAESYQTWRITVEPWMAIPRKGIAYRAISPSESPNFRYP